MSWANYRFYVLNRRDRITHVHILGCEHEAMVEDAARELLDQEPAWCRDRGLGPGPAHLPSRAYKSSLLACGFAGPTLRDDTCHIVSPMPNIKWARELLPQAQSFTAMREPRYYRDESARARRLANSVNHAEARDALLKMSQEYEELAIDLENGAVEIRHPELMPQANHNRKQS